MTTNPQRDPGGVLLQVGIDHGVRVGSWQGWKLAQAAARPGRRTTWPARPAGSPSARLASSSTWARPGIRRLRGGAGAADNSLSTI